MMEMTLLMSGIGEIMTINHVVNIIIIISIIIIIHLPYNWGKLTAFAL